MCGDNRKKKNCGQLHIKETYFVVNCSEIYNLLRKGNINLLSVWLVNILLQNISLFSLVSKANSSVFQLVELFLILHPVEHTLKRADTRHADYLDSLCFWHIWNFAIKFWQILSSLFPYYFTLVKESLRKLMIDVSYAQKLLVIPFSLWKVAWGCYAQSTSDRFTSSIATGIHLWKAAPRCTGHFLVSALLREAVWHHQLCLPLIK